MVTPDKNFKDIIDEFAKYLTSQGWCKLAANGNCVVPYNRLNKLSVPVDTLEHMFSDWKYQHYRNTKLSFEDYRKVNASTLRRLKLIMGSKFKPDKTPFIKCEYSNCLFANTFIPYKTTTDYDKDANLSLLLEFFERLFPIEEERHICVSWLSHSFQYPLQRPSWHLLLTSDVGIGKGRLFEDILMPLWNRQVKPYRNMNEITGRSNEAMTDNIFILMDDFKPLSENEYRSMLSLLTMEKLTNHRHYSNQTLTDAYSRVIFASNEHIPVRLPATDRRWYAPTRLVHKVDKVETQQFIIKLLAWLETPGNLDKVYYYFMNYNLKDFNHKSIHQSEQLKIIIGQSEDIHISILQDYILNSDSKVFNTAEMTKIYEDAKISQPAPQRISDLLSAVGYEKRRITFEDGSKVTICYPVGMLDTDIRNAWRKFTEYQ